MFTVAFYLINFEGYNTYHFYAYLSKKEEELNNWKEMNPTVHVNVVERVNVRLLQDDLGIRIIPRKLFYEKSHTQGNTQGNDDKP